MNCHICKFRKNILSDHKINDFFKERLATVLSTNEDCRTNPCRCPEYLTVNNPCYEKSNKICKNCLGDITKRPWTTYFGGPPKMQVYRCWIYFLTGEDIGNNYGSKTLRLTKKMFLEKTKQSITQILGKVEHGKFCRINKYNICVPYKNKNLILSIRIINMKREKLTSKCVYCGETISFTRRMCKKAECQKTHDKIMARCDIMHGRHLPENSQAR